MNALLESIDFQDRDVSLDHGHLLILQSSRACLSQKGLLSDHHIPYILSCISLANSRKHDSNTTLKVPFSPDDRYNLLIRQTEKFIIVVCNPAKDSSTSQQQQQPQPQQIGLSSSNTPDTEDFTSASATPRASAW